MHTRFRRHHAERVVSIDGERRGLDPCFFAVLDFKNPRLEPAAFGPTQVHPHQHLGPILRLCAAGARMDIDDGIKAVVLARKQQLRLNLFDERLEIRQRGLQLFLDRLAFTRQVYQSLCIVYLAGNLPVERQSFFESCALLKGFARTVLIGPEAWIANYRLEFIKLTLAGACVKETSGRLRPGISPYRILQSIRRT